MPQGYKRAKPKRKRAKRKRPKQPVYDGVQYSSEAAYQRYLDHRRTLTDSEREREDQELAKKPKRKKAKRPKQPTYDGVQYSSEAAYQRHLAALPALTGSEREREDQRKRTLQSLADRMDQGSRALHVRAVSEGWKRKIDWRSLR